MKILDIALSSNVGITLHRLSQQCCSTECGHNSCVCFFHMLPISVIIKEAQLPLLKSHHISMSSATAVGLEPRLPSNMKLCGIFTQWLKSNYFAQVMCGRYLGYAMEPLRSLHRSKFVLELRYQPQSVKLPGGPQHYKGIKRAVMN